MIEPRQSTTVPNVSKTSAFGITVAADANLGTATTVSPVAKYFKASLRCMVRGIIYNASRPCIKGGRKPNAIRYASGFLLRGIEPDCKRAVAGLQESEDSANGGWKTQPESSCSEASRRNPGFIGNLGRAEREVSCESRGGWYRGPNAALG